jgi:hypothetical protein
MSKRKTTPEVSAFDHVMRELRTMRLHVTALGEQVREGLGEAAYRAFQRKQKIAQDGKEDIRAPMLRGLTKQPLNEQ